MEIIEREIVENIFEWIGEQKIIVIKGARQVGKTTILNILMKKLDGLGQKVIYFSVDSEIGNPLFKDPKIMIRFLERELKEGKIVLFLDEFQYIKEAGLYLKVLFDSLKEQVQIIVSGSSSLEITKNREFLTGRKIEFVVYPLSFRELAGFRLNYKTKSNVSLSSWKEIEDIYFIYGKELNLILIEYINWGGFPEIIQKPSEKKRAILSDIVTTYIRKDIAGFLKVERIEAFNNLLRVLSSQIGSLVNQSELSNTLQINLRTLKKYIDILKGTFILFLVSPYFVNIRKEIRKMKKVYLLDFGLRNFLLKKAQHANLDLIHGSEVENFIYSSLVSIEDEDSIFYYRTISGSEIDFIVTKEDELVPIEVKYRRGNIKPTQAVNNFSQRFKQRVKKRVIITRDYLHRDDDTYFIPAVIFPFIKLKESS